MKGFEKTKYNLVQFIYSDYTDYSETFESDWNMTEMIKYMRESEYNKRKEVENLQITDIYVSKVVKFSKDMWI